MCVYICRKYLFNVIGRRGVLMRGYIEIGNNRNGSKIFKYLNATVYQNWSTD